MEPECKSLPLFALRCTAWIIPCWLAVTKRILPLLAFIHNTPPLLSEREETTPYFILIKRLNLLEWALKETTFRLTAFRQTAELTWATPPKVYIRPLLPIPRQVPIPSLDNCNEHSFPLAVTYSTFRLLNESLAIIPEVERVPPLSNTRLKPFPPHKKSFPVSLTQSAFPLLRSKERIV